MIRCVSQSHNGCTVLLACPTQVTPWSSYHNAWQLLPPVCTKCLVIYRSYSSFAAALLVACPNFLQREKIQYVRILNIPIFFFKIYSALLLESSKSEYLQVTNLASYESTFYNNIVVCKFIQPMHITQIIITCNTRLLLFCTLLLSDVGNTLTSSLLNHMAGE